MNLVVILLTYKRTEYAIRALLSAHKNLRYSLGSISYYIADDGSDQTHLSALLDCLKENSMPFLDWHTIPNGSYGANANKAWHTAHDHTDLTLFLEDDWELEQELDLDPFVRLLLDHSWVGMVRLGYLNLNMRGNVFSHAGKLFWKLDRDCDPYVFTGHPSLRHRRFREDYGAYPEGLDPGQTELGYAMQFRYKQGSEIVYPVMLGEGHHYFAHIGQEKSY